MLTEEHYMDLIDAWLEGRLEGTALETFEREQRDNPAFAEQCLLAAALKEQERRRDKQDFLSKLSNIEEELKTEGFFGAATVPAQMEEPVFSEKIKNIEAELTAEGFPMVVTKPKRAWRVTIGRSLLATAAILTGLVAATYFLLIRQESTFQIAATAKEHAPQPSFEANRGYLGSLKAVDSLYLLGQYVAVFENLKDQAALPPEYLFKRAVSRINSAQKPADAESAIEDLLRFNEALQAANQQGFEPPFGRAEWYSASYLALAYLQANRKKDAEKILRKLEAESDGNFKQFASGLLKKI
jgi:hypothetical protein